MSPFEYLVPATLAEAVAMLARYEGRANLLAGGTDLLVEIKEQIRRPEYIIDIKKIPGLDQLRYDARYGLRIGALVTARAVETLPEAQLHYPGLVQSVKDLGSIQVRNRATVVGNVCRASPSADTLPPLIVDGASLRLHGPDGERVVALEEFFTGPGRTVLGPRELVCEIMLPPPPAHTGKAYIKHGRRKAMELASVGVAVCITLDGSRCRDIRIGLGAVAPTPIRALRAEAMLRGCEIDASRIGAAAQAAMDESRPISNVRASAQYRREMVGVLTLRAIRQAQEAAR